MAFCFMSNGSIMDGFTSVDNAFLKDFMPLAPAVATKIYLYGLFLCGKQQDVNTLQQLMRELNVSKDDVLDAFTYWEECGVVNIASKSPLTIEYVGASNRNMLKKVSAAKYKSFNKQMQQVLCGRMISVNEYSEYYSFLENTFFDPEGLVQIAKYCADIKGNDIGYAYILKIAHDWDKAGYKTADKILEKIKTQNFYNDELSQILKALSVKRAIDIEDRRLYQKWTEEMGFCFDVLLELSKRCKRLGMSRLDTLVNRYYKLRLFSLKEIDSYEQSKEQTKDLAIQVNRALGLYYADTQSEVEEYISPWLSKGFSASTIVMLAKFCFKCRIQSLEGLNTRINSLAQRGLVSDESILSYTEEVLSADRKIAQVLDALGIVRGVCAADRKNYKNWQEWGYQEGTIMYVAGECASLFNPMASLNKVLADLKQKGDLSVNAAKAYFVSNVNTSIDKNKQKKDNSFLLAEDRTYSADQLNAMFDELREE